MKLQRIVTGTALSMMMFAAAQAQATDAKQYPGIACRATSTTDGNYTVYGGTVQNKGGLPLPVACPLVHDNTTTGVSSASLKVFDRNVDQDFTDCIMHSESASGSGFTVDTEPGVYGGGYGSNVMTINFGDLAGGEYLWLECKIPPRYGTSGNYQYSHLASITVNEI